MAQGSDWPKRAAAGIGERIAFYRDQQKLSAQQLADRCSELGMPSISRVVITKLENGRREAVSTSELAVLAMALGVPPVLLLFPLGYVAEVEVLPGRHAAPSSAIGWFSGDRSSPDGPAASPQLDSRSPIVLWTSHLRHEHQIQRLYEYRDISMHPRGRADGDTALVTPSIFEENIEAMTDLLRRVRQTMREIGMTPPPFQPETALIISEEAVDGPH